MAYVSRYSVSLKALSILNHNHCSISIADVLGRLVGIGALVDQEVQAKQRKVKKIVLRIQISREPMTKEVQLIRKENEIFDVKAETMIVEEVKRQRSMAKLADLEPPYPRPKTSVRTTQRLIAQGMGQKIPKSPFGSN
ncbi:hypothetical protein Sjap_004987 [Stephania japonica]|uniref:Uncharacterized protein n=1 Tax=Stephania japonica TaxID=461633 RepID=A0AAP0K4I8_9MAGN